MPPVEPTPPVEPAPSGPFESALVAGGEWGYADGPALQARFSWSSAASFWAGGGGGMRFTDTGALLMADRWNHAVRKLSTDGQVTTVAGGGPRDFGFLDGPGVAARFYRPTDLATDAQGNAYVTDYENHLVRKIDASGQVSTFAGQLGVCGDTDGVGTAATLCYPGAVAVDKTGNVFVSQRRQQAGQDVANSIRKITPAGTVTTFASQVSEYPSLFDQAVWWASYYDPVRLAVDANGTVYAADANDHVIRRYAQDGSVSVMSGTVSGEERLPGKRQATNAGFADGPASAAKFGELRSIALDAADRLYVLDAHDDAAGIRRIDPDGSVTTIIRGSCVAGDAICGSRSLAIRGVSAFWTTEYQVSPNGGLPYYSWIRKYTAAGAS